MTCPGKPRAQEGLSENPSKMGFSVEGTAAHHFRELALLSNLEISAFKGQVYKQKSSALEFQIECTPEMISALEPGIDRLLEHHGPLFIEHRVDIGRWIPGGFGTLDAGLINPNYILINDLKFGAGVPVSPIENKQMRIYAAGFWDKIARHRTRASRVILDIDQPRCSGGGGEFEDHIDDILDFMEEVKVAAKRTEDPRAPRIPSEKACRFCLAKDTDRCPEYTQFMIGMMGMDYEDLDAADRAEREGRPSPIELPKALTPERRSVIIRHRDMIIQWLKRLHTAAIEDFKAGHPVPGLKAVEGRAGKRVWNDESEILAHLFGLMIAEETIYKREIRSPAQIEKLLSKTEKSRLKDYYTQKRGAPKLVSATDPRPALVGEDLAQDYDDLDEEDYED